ncbi:MAG TPA: hypothetical protein DDW84_00275 [Phycisphaerales bacterium]|nr:MAG: hypothetical protein A2Y13_08325 [Planctomycetes bacterium GWC2_45_44]HBG77273.1 hypothetical protein [Phycisphaerales bacterium]HBR19708.1 hypothetical protein [Phycisphaerales bacterium]
MNIKNIVLIVIVAVLALGILYAKYDSDRSRDRIDLKFRLKAGESHEFKIIQFQSVSQRFEDKGVDMNAVADTVIGLNVIGVDANGSMDAAITFKSIKLGIDTDYGHLEFDPENPKQVDPNDKAQQAFVMLFSNVLGSSLKMRITSTGEVSDIIGIDDIFTKFKNEMTKLEAKNEPNNPEQKEMLEAFKKALGANNEKKFEEFFYKFFNGNLVRDLTDSAILRFSADPVAVSKKWQYKQRLNLGFAIDVNTVCKLERHNGGIAYIDTVSKLDMNELKVADITAREKILMKLSGTANSTVEVDETIGLVRKSDVRIKLSGIRRIEPDRMTLPIRPNMNLQLQIDGYTTVKLIK